MSRVLNLNQVRCNLYDRCILASAMLSCNVCDMSDNYSTRANRAYVIRSIDGRRSPRSLIDSCTYGTLIFESHVASIAFVTDRYPTASFVACLPLPTYTLHISCTARKS